MRRAWRARYRQQIGNAPTWRGGKTSMGIEQQAVRRVRGVGR